MLKSRKFPGVEVGVVAAPNGTSEFKQYTLIIRMQANTEHLFGVLIRHITEEIQRGNSQSDVTISIAPKHCDLRMQITHTKLILVQFEKWLKEFLGAE